MLLWDVNKLEKTVYIRLRHRVFIQPNDKIFLKDIAQIIAEDALHNQIGNRVLYQADAKDRNIIIIDVMQVMEEIKKFDSMIEVQIIGPSQTIIEVVYKKRKISPILILNHLVFIIFWIHAYDYEFS